MPADLTQPQNVPKTPESMTATTDIAISGDAQLTNDDLLPVPLRKRTWGAWNFAALWMGMVHSAFGFAVIGGQKDATSYFIAADDTDLAKKMEDTVRAAF